MKASTCERASDIYTRRKSQNCCFANAIFDKSVMGTFKQSKTQICLNDNEKNRTAHNTALQNSSESKYTNCDSFYLYEGGHKYVQANYHVICIDELCHQDAETTIQSFIHSPDPVDCATTLKRQPVPLHITLTIKSKTLVFPAHTSFPESISILAASLEFMSRAQASPFLLKYLMKCHFTHNSGFYFQKQKRNDLTVSH